MKFFVGPPYIFPRNCLSCLKNSIFLILNLVRIYIKKLGINVFSFANIVIFNSQHSLPKASNCCFSNCRIPVLCFPVAFSDLSSAYWHSDFSVGLSKLIQTLFDSSDVERSLKLFTTKRTIELIGLLKDNYDDIRQSTLDLLTHPLLKDRVKKTVSKLLIA